ncbi:hypothetical protein [Pedobacter chinensis]|nr:hypothetical protein [Pedobacter chinensis]
MKNLKISAKAVLNIIMMLPAIFSIYIGLVLLNVFDQVACAWRGTLKNVKLPQSADLQFVFLSLHHDDLHLVSFQERRFQAKIVD